MDSRSVHSGHLRMNRSAVFVVSTVLTAGISVVPLSAAMPLPVQAEQLTSDGHPYDAAAEAERQQLPVQTNDIQNWPQGPTVSAGSAILMDVNTGTVFYAKNIHEKMYPASTTKLLTCLIAAERLNLDDTVTFSEEAVNSVPADGSNIGMDAGETITVEQCLYGILVGSANECANAIAEKVAGSISAFADLMNERAEELGCTDSHFANANGLFDENHYTSAHDLCLIGKAFFQNDILIRIGCTPSYHFTATATQPDDFWIQNKHGLINGTYAYDGVLGGKTGYTSQSKETLVTGCERNGLRLVCVVMKEDAPKQFEDTISLFNYGYDNFTRVNAADNDTKYTVSSAGFLQSGTDLLGSSTPAFSIDSSDYVDVPSTTTFDQLQSTIGTDNTITYTMNDLAADDRRNAVLGTAQLVRNSTAGGAEEPASGAAAASTESEQNPNSALSAQGTDKTADAEQKDSITKLLHSIQSFYYSVGHNGTIYINMTALVLTLSILVFAIAVISCIGAAVSHARALRRRRSRSYRRR